MKGDSETKNADIMSSISDQSGGLGSISTPSVTPKEPHPSSNKLPQKNPIVASMGFFKKILMFLEM